MKLLLKEQRMNVNYEANASEHSKKVLASLKIAVNNALDKKRN